jgi:hypothetical protein
MSFDILSLTEYDNNSLIHCDTITIFLILYLAHSQTVPFLPFAQCHFIPGPRAQGVHADSLKENER